MTKNVCISGYFGFDNFGDETILKVLIDNLKKTDKSIQITVFSSNPHKTSELYNVKSVQTFSLTQVVKTIKNSDCLISGGGSLLQDVTSKKSLLYYLSVIFFAQIFKKKTVIFAQGIGPINNIFLKKITRFLLNNTSFISVRDIESKKLLDKWNIKSQLMPDPVFNIEPVTVTKSDKIGIQLRNYKNLTDEFLKELSFCINKFFSNKDIYLLSMQNSVDIPALNKLKTYIPNAVIVENTSNDKIIEDIAQLDTLIAMRYHACLIAIKNNVKLLPISYDIKVKTLASEFNLDFIDLDKKENLNNTFEKFLKTNIRYNCHKEYDFNLLKEIILH